MSGWIPRRLGGGLGGKKESGQLRFGGRERPFRAPLRPIPYDDLKRLGIPPPPEGRYLSRFQVPSPPRSGNHMEEEDSPARHRAFGDREDTPARRRSGGAATYQEHSKLRYQRYEEREEIPSKSRDDSHSRHIRSEDREETPAKSKNSYTVREESPHRHRSSVDKDSTRKRRRRRSPSGGAESSHKLHRDYTERSHRHKKRSPS